MFHAAIIYIRDSYLKLCFCMEISAYFEIKSFLSNRSRSLYKYSLIIYLYFNFITYFEMVTKFKQSIKHFLKIIYNLCVYICIWYKDIFKTNYLIKRSFANVCYTLKEKKILIPTKLPDTVCTAWPTSAVKAFKHAINFKNA